MTTKKWVLLIVSGMAGCAVLVAIGLFAWFFGLGSAGVDGWMPVYKTEQTASTHPGFLHTTVTSGTSVYVSDYEEYALEVENKEPKNAIGRQPVGGASVYAIDGQKATDYIAVDEGSEMPAYGVYRNSQLPPFDWQHAKFQLMILSGSISPRVGQRVTDPALIDDVVTALRDGTPVPSPTLAAGNAKNIHALSLCTDQLPGIVYSPKVYVDPAGPVYLASSVAMVSPNSNQWKEARWVPAGPLFTKWVRMP